jgi:cardiolipin synthase
MLSVLEQLRPAIIATLSALLAVIASAHAVMRKRDSRAALGWVGVIWLVPIVGPVLYVLLGINRIERRAKALRAGLPVGLGDRDVGTDWRAVGVELMEASGHLGALARVVGQVTDSPLTAGNHVEPLQNGDAAFPAMLETIDSAERSLAFSTYIFDHDETGETFADALQRAVNRGVAVRVLIDSIGARYSWPSMVGQLRKRGVRVARFMQAILPWRMPFFNLRNHRKILVADGGVAFTGGMNVRDGHVLAKGPRRPIQDLQFKVEGPVVQQLMWVFAEDWAFSTKEALGGDLWFPRLEEVGAVIARGIPDGPGEDFDKMRLTLLGGVQTAEYRICIVTPYFLPDRDLISALAVAAMRGVEVDIVLPSVNNQPLVAWASTALLWQLLERGCRVFLTPPPFDHTKLMVVDDLWTLIGSANWDPRSLRLNFEFNVECYDRELARSMTQLAADKVARASQTTQAAVDGRSVPVRLRDGVARLLSPYL